MNADVKRSRDTHSDDWARGTLLFRNWEEIKKEVLLHKWYESEKAGHDIGWERAMIDWMAKFGRKQTRP